MPRLSFCQLLSKAKFPIVILVSPTPILTLRLLFKSISHYMLRTLSRRVLEPSSLLEPHVMSPDLVGNFRSLSSSNSVNTSCDAHCSASRNQDIQDGCHGSGPPRWLPVISPLIFTALCPFSLKPLLVYVVHLRVSSCLSVCLCLPVCLSLSPCLLATQGKIICHVLRQPRKETHMAKNWGLQLTAMWVGLETNPPTPVEPWGDCSPSWCLIITSWEIQNQSAVLSLRQ